MYDDLRGRLKELAKIELHDDGMGVYRISAEGLEIIKGLAQAAEAAIEDLSEQLSEQEVTPEAGHFIDKYADRILSELQELKGSIKDKPRWTSVKERMPEDGKNVLAYEGGGFYFLDWCCDGNWVVASASTAVVTHWMPLPPAPEPPKEEA